MILALVAIGDKYISNCEPHIKNFINNGWDVHILTSETDEFNLGKTYKYQNKIFSYFDKLLFFLRLSEEYDKGVLYVDSDWIQFINSDFPNRFKGSENFLYYGYWPNGFMNYQDNPYFKHILDYFNMEGITHNEIPPLLEWIFYIPPIKNISNVIYEVEKVKPIFDYMSTVVNAGYFGMGNGEGIGLSYSLYKNNIIPYEFDKTHFKVDEINDLI